MFGFFEPGSDATRRSRHLLWPGRRRKSPQFGLVGAGGEYCSCGDPAGCCTRPAQDQKQRGCTSRWEACYTARELSIACRAERRRRREKSGLARRADVANQRARDALDRTRCPTEIGTIQYKSLDLKGGSAGRKVHGD